MSCCELRTALRSSCPHLFPPSCDLEQEVWFEKEIAFLPCFLRPGMTAIDIGANLGVYSIPMARLVGSQGQVFAYEPASEPRALLDQSRVLNQASNLQIIPAAVSDHEGKGHLVLGASSELNTLHGIGRGESVQVTFLDLDDRSRGWNQVDFVKIDAEGEEDRILEGGRAFFAHHSPLVMFEVKAVEKVNENLRSAFRSLGYQVYRLLPGAPVLVPDDQRKPLDSYEMNLFAAKPDRAASLANEGLLVDILPNWMPDANAGQRALDIVRSQTFASSFADLLAAGSSIDAVYRAALGAYAVWRSSTAEVATRCAALDYASNELVFCPGNSLTKSSKFLEDSISGSGPHERA